MTTINDHDKKTHSKAKEISTETNYRPKHLLHTRVLKLTEIDHFC